jgi:hypothetical protein
MVDFSASLVSAFVAVDRFFIAIKRYENAGKNGILSRFRQALRGWCR